MIEFYNDEKVIRVLRALEKYRQALSIGSPALVFGMETNAHILLFFKENRMIERVKKRLLEDTRFIPFMPYIHFLTMKDKTLSKTLQAVFKILK